MRIKDFGFKHLGQLVHRKSTQIASSKLGIGFETLDRDMWDVTCAWPVLEDLGVKWARVQSGWAKTETIEGQYDFAWLDAIVDGLREHGVQPWLSVSYGNSLYTPGAPVDAAGNPPVYTERERRGWAAYVKALARHYRGRVERFEIWNEPDCSGFFRPEPNAELYAALVAATAPILRAEVPGAYIVAGAFGRAMTPIGLAYADTCLRQGMADHCDAISYHGYKYMPEQYLDQELPAFEHLLARHKPGLKRWQGETGCPSKNPPGCTMALNEMKATEDVQVRWLLRRVLLELGTGVELLNYFTMCDFSRYLLGGDLGFSSHKGVLRMEDGSRKPSYFALQSLATLLHDPLEPAAGRTSFRLQTGDDDNSVSHEQAAAAYQVNLLRGDIPVQAWWLREAVEKDSEWKSITLHCWLDEGLRLDRPVLVNPATQDVCELPVKRNAGMGEFVNLPISNSPLLITDRSIVDVQS